MGEDWDCHSLPGAGWADWLGGLGWLMPLGAGAGRLARLAEIDCAAELGLVDAGQIVNRGVLHRARIGWNWAGRGLVD